MLRLLILLFALGCQEKTEKIIEVEGPPPRVFPPPPGPVPDPVPNNPDFVGFENFESNLLLDVNTVPGAQRVRARYLHVCDKFNEKSARMQAFVNAINKGVNHLSTDRELKRLIPADPNECLYRMDLDDFGLSAKDWNLIERADPFKLESFTTRGILIKQLTQTARPWIHAANFNFVGLNDNVYYKIVDVPDTVKAIWANIGVDVQEDFDAFDDQLFLLGFFGSPISLQKNRMLLRVEGRDGPAWSTYDTITTDGVDAARNLFENPFPIEARSRRVFAHDGQEFIWTLPNGLHAYALADGVGNLQTEAPLNLVVDVNAGGLDPTIRNAFSCLRCHAGGVISNDDQIRAHVESNPNFNAIDRQLANALFRPKAANDAIFSQDKQRYASALAQLSINSTEDDPVNALGDEYRKEWDLGQLAAFYFLKQDEMRSCIQGSAETLEQAGQVLNGGTISLEQVISTNQFIVRDCNLFQDDLNE